MFRRWFDPSAHVRELEVVECSTILHAGGGMPLERTRTMHESENALNRITLVCLQ